MNVLKPLNCMLSKGEFHSMQITIKNNLCKLYLKKAVIREFNQKKFLCVDIFGCFSVVNF